MASLFKPPETTRQNPKTPKLKLPSVQQQGTSPGYRPPSNKNSNIYNVNRINGQTSGNMATPLSLNIRNTNTTLPPLPKMNMNVTSMGEPISDRSRSDSVTSSSSKTPTSSGSSRRRPVPPPIQGITMTDISPASRTRPPPSMSPVDIQNSLKTLSINTEKPNPVDRQSTEPDHDTPCSQDSYISNLLSNYEESASSTTSPSVNMNNGPYPDSMTSTSSSSGRTISEQAIPPKLDVTDLGENLWHFKHLKEEIVTLGVLGEGAGGSVAKCKLKRGSTIFALKTINVLNTDPEFQKQIFRELQFNKSFKSDYIVRYYGMFTDEENSSIYIAMEYMGGRSLEAVYKNLMKRGGRISEKVLGKVAESVLRGLSYLHEKKIIHRDIKPQNILLSDSGEVKLCDFGVSGEAVNSLATTFTGTSFYMAPERIQGQPYSVTCDVWSLGLTILEVAQGHFPFGSDKITANIAPIELLMLIITFEPQLKDEEENNIKWSGSFKSFIAYCLKKDPAERPSPRQMLQHPWIQGQMKKRVNMEKFIHRCWEE
ncbi:similar to Saccharomyces cerevisiae YPL140C MKK2 Mitogen-activated kinase kinase involved in protein kinase C signaling pathway that controls cell integrity [Maudiozyma saulgeensis]|uniref:mitogen-activated protein kinase kinase n=1 Tax=Maudiozyma saulgeensis TaxID=1789683 RepID=A0A1X7R3H6_9SACH|nr:similar to Saccharomyces cerevisiae YPL140C MKK2 Mitogen-activated kinase kinase involved in protein kinase C signaling pathway that controls cell integrity [Kazachstania saulgeensis]